MSRLTKRVIDEVLLDGAVSSICKEVCESLDNFDHPCDMCPINEAIKKLAHYEDLEEQGKLIELPCKVGDTVYAIRHYGMEYRIEKTTVDAICIVRSVIFTKDYDTERSYNIKELIATKEEAEAKLAELGGKA